MHWKFYCLKISTVAIVVRNIFVLLALPLANTLDLLATHDPDADEENEEETPVYEKFDPLLHKDHGKNKRYSIVFKWKLSNNMW